MQSLLFRTRKLGWCLTKYFQAISSLNGHQYNLPLSANSSLILFRNGQKHLQESNKQMDNNNDWKKGSMNENSNQDEDNERQKKAEKMGRRLGIFTVALMFFYLNVSYLQKVEELQRKMEAKDNELKEERKMKQALITSGGENLEILNQKVTNQGNAVPKKTKVTSTLITWNEFISDYLQAGNVIELVANRKSELVMIKLKNPVEFANRNIEYLFMQMPSDMLENKLEQVQDELNIQPRVYIQYKSNEFSQNLLNAILIGGLFLVLFRFGRAALEKLQQMQTEMYSKYTNKKFHVVDPHLKTGSPKVTFKDVAGLHEAKIEIKEFVEYLREPERFKKLGAKVPKGALLTGPPGCGKTLLAKAVANEANVPFFNVAGTEFIEMIGGVGASRVRALFEEARKQSPAIIFIDEIDAIGRKRSDNQNPTGGSGEFDQTLNQLLVSMDGLESSSHVVVLASTNRADILDKALLRPGRLDRLIDIDLPTYLERIEILDVHLKQLKLDFFEKNREEFVSQLAHLTPGFSGADLANICNEAALMAARLGSTEISKKNFYSALERVIAGAEKKNSIISVEDKKLIAYRECGKVVISWFHEYSDLILKVSLLHRTKLNAFSQTLSSDRKLYSKDELFDQMCLNFGGRAAETLIFNTTTTNSESDLRKVTDMAYAQVESLGMNDVVGNISFPTRAEEKRSGGMIGEKPYSRKLRNVIDYEVGKLVTSAHDRSIETLKAHVDVLHKLVEELLKRETLTYSEIVELIGEPVKKERYKTATAHLTVDNQK